MSDTGKNPENDFDFEAYDETGDFEYDPEMDMSHADFDDLPADEGDLPPLDNDDAETSAPVHESAGDDEYYDTDMNAAPIAQKKKSSLVFYLVLVLVVLGGGFFVFSTFMTGPEIPPRPVQAQYDDLGTPQDLANGTAPMDPAGMGMAPLNDMQAQQNPDLNAYPSDMPQGPDGSGNVDPNAAMGMDTGVDPLAQNNEFVPTNDPAANQLEAQQQAVDNTFDQQQGFAPLEDATQNTVSGAPLPVNPDATPQTNMVTANNIAETNANQTAAIVPPTPSQNTTDTQLNNEILTALNGIQDGIAQLRQTMNSLEVRVTALENAPAPEAAPAPVAQTGANTSEVVALQKDMKSMQSKLGQLEDGMATQTAAVKEALALMKKQTQAAAAAPKTVAPAPVKTAAAAAKPSPAPAPVKTAAPTPAPASVTWKLQGAQPGKAWLTRAGGGEPVTATTGAFLPGLGRINFIGQRNGRWMVEGSEGRVSE